MFPSSLLSSTPNNESKITRISSIEQSSLEFENSVNELRNKWSSLRYRNTTRPYKPEHIVKKRSRLYQQYPSNLLAHKLWSTLKFKQQNMQAIMTFGSVDVVQALHASKFTDAVLISGSHVSINSNQPSEPSPKQAGYDLSTIPLIVKQVFKAQEFYDVKQNEFQFSKTRIDYFKPIIADADNGHGSTTTLMHLTRMFVENGASGIIIDDQALGTYSTNSLFGKVVVPLYKAINRLVAIRAQLDILDVDQVILCRTDCNEATLITCNSDIRDHRFLLGATVPLQSLVRVLAQAATFGADDEKLMQLERDWLQESKLMTYIDAVVEHMKLNYKIPGIQLEKNINDWKIRAKFLSLGDQKALAGTLGINIYWSCDSPRTSQGFYRYSGNVDAAISRGNYLASYCDVLCYESTGPDYEELKAFSTGIKAYNPECMLGYDFTTSYNWDARGISDTNLQSSSTLLGQMGFCWQSIKTGGVHAISLMSDQFCRDLSNRGINAYVEDVQRPQKFNNIDPLNDHIITGSFFYNQLNSTAQKSFRINPYYCNSQDRMAMLQWEQTYNKEIKIPINNNVNNQPVDKSIFHNKAQIEHIMLDFYNKYKGMYDLDNQARPIQSIQQNNTEISEIPKNPDTSDE